MKKFLTMLVLIGFVLGSFAPLAMAGDNDARQLDAFDVDQIVALADGQADTAEISDEGAVYVKQAGAATIGFANKDSIVYTGACTVYSATIHGFSGSSDKDWVAVHDALSATGTPKFDISIATSGGTFQARFTGLTFSTGIYVNTIDDDNIQLFVEYDT